MKPLSSLRPLAFWFLVLPLWLAGPAAWAQPTWQSAIAVGALQTAGSSSRVVGIATDASGNMYLAGEFSGTVSFGTTTLTSAGGQDVFVAKVNPTTNQFLWAQRAGGSEEEEAGALAVSGTSVYVTGRFIGATTSLGSTVLANADASGTSRDVFVAKLTDAGATSSFTWARRMGGLRNDYTAYGMAVSGTNIYVAGEFFGPTADFGPATLTNANASPTPSADVFVTKLTDAGSTSSFAWAQRAGGRADEYVTALAMNGTSVYVAGGFDGTTGFGSTSLTSAGGYDVFVAKLTDAGSTGNFTWAQRAGGTTYDAAWALAVSGPNVYVAGGFESATAGFGATTLTTAGDRDAFVAKLADAGPSAGFVWAQRAGGADYEIAYGLAVSGTNIYVAGEFDSSSAGFGSTTLAPAQQSDVFVAKLTDGGPNAGFAWAQQAGSLDHDGTYAVAASGNRVYVVGSVGMPASFGTQVIPSTLGPVGGIPTVGYLAALTDPTLTATTPTPASAGLDLYPNPAQSTATVALPAGLGTAAATLTLADAQGRVVRTQTLAVPAAGRRYVLDLRGLTPGVYALRVQAGAGTVVRRLVVE